MVSVALARTLGAAAFGVFAVLAATMAIAGGLADFGLTGAAVRRIAGEAGEQCRLQAWRGFVALRLAGAAIVAGVGIAAAGWLCRRVLAIPGHESLLRLALVGMVATAVSGAMTAGLQATGRFRSLATVMLVNAVLSALLAVALAATGWLTLTTALAVLGIATALASAVVGWRLLPDELRSIRPSRDDVHAEGRPLLRFGAWLWVASTLGLLAGQLDILLLGHWSSSEVVGAYALAVALASKADVLNQSLHAVLLPGAARLRSSREGR
ncbi:MAG TPA: oligosaccharide flippase family protein, partial [Thermomicrobiales bacterium]|nr:oligosaccharide flippase family protein [Thermomicrobiales bacterium]